MVEYKVICVTLWRVNKTAKKIVRILSEAAFLNMTIQNAFIIWVLYKDPQGGSKPCTYSIEEHQGKKILGL